MSEVLVLAGVVITALLTVLSVVVAQLYKRVADLEDYNRRLWGHTRYLLDLYYRHRQPGAPDPAPLPDDE